MSLLDADIQPGPEAVRWDAADVCSSAEAYLGDNNIVIEPPLENDEALAIAGLLNRDKKHVTDTHADEYDIRFKIVTARQFGRDARWVTMLGILRALETQPHPRAREKMQS